MTIIERYGLKRPSDTGEIDRLHNYAADKKVGLVRPGRPSRGAKGSGGLAAKGNAELERIQAQKHATLLQMDLRHREQNLFFDGLRLEQALDDQLAELMDKVKLVAEVKREFVIWVEGESNEDFTYLHRKLSKHKGVGFFSRKLLRVDW